MSTQAKATAACDQALGLAFGCRQEDYGDPSDSFERIAKLWCAYKGVPFRQHEVAVMLMLMKVSRSTTDDKPDTWHDMIAYAAIGAALR